MGLYVYTYSTTITGLKNIKPLVKSYFMPYTSVWNNREFFDFLYISDITVFVAI